MPIQFFHLWCAVFTDIAYLFVRDLAYLFLWTVVPIFTMFSAFEALRRVLVSFGVLARDACGTDDVSPDDDWAYLASGIETPRGWAE